MTAEASTTPPATPTPFRTLDVRRWTGISASAVAILLFAEFLVRVLAVGARPQLSDSAALVEFMTRTGTWTLVIVLIDTVLMAWVMVFLACFRNLITAARPDLEWIASIAFGAGLVFVGVTLV